MQKTFLALWTTNVFFCLEPQSFFNNECYEHDCKLPIFSFFYLKKFKFSQGMLSFIFLLLKFLDGILMGSLEEGNLVRLFLIRQNDKIVSISGTFAYSTMYKTNSINKKVLIHKNYLSSDDIKFDLNVWIKLREVPDSRLNWPRFYFSHLLHIMQSIN